MDVLDAEVGMLEEVGDLVIDLEGIVIVEEIEVEQLGHTQSVLQTNTGRHHFG